MIYCVSDIHGHYDKWCELLKKIHLTDEDTLYVLGDVCDRGPEPTRILLDMMDRVNVIPIAGNHDVLASYCLHLLTQELTEELAEELDTNTMRMIMEWLSDGGQATAADFKKLSKEEQETLLDYILDFDLYAQVSAGGKEYFLVHAGLEHFSPEKLPEDYSMADMISCRTDYEKEYFPDKILVTGHTPTQLIPGNPNPGRIYKKHNHLAIDCGCGFGGALGAVCLNTGEEFYVE